MITMMRLGLQEAAIRWRMTVVMGLTVSASLVCFLVMNAYRTGLVSRYAVLVKDYLVVEESGSMGEWYGSRLPASLAQNLLAVGTPRLYQKFIQLLEPRLKMPCCCGGSVWTTMLRWRISR